MSIRKRLLFNLKIHIIIPQFNMWSKNMSEVDLNSIGKRIQKLRKQRDYTQEDLAEMMNVSIQMISNLERGMKAIRIDNLINLSRILDVSTDYILMGKETIEDFTTLTAHISKLSPKDQKTISLLVEYFLNESL